MVVNVEPGAARGVIENPVGVGTPVAVAAARERICGLTARGSWA